MALGSKSVKVDGIAKTIDVAPISRKIRTLLPARFIAESLGATVSYDTKTKRTKIVKDGLTISLVLNSSKAYINGKAVTLDSPAISEGNRIYTPLRFISEALNAKVSYGTKTKQIMVVNPQASVE